MKTKHNPHSRRTRVGKLARQGYDHKRNYFLNRLATDTIPKSIRRRRSWFVNEVLQGKTLHLTIHRADRQPGTFLDRFDRNECGTLAGAKLAAREKARRLVLGGYSVAADGNILDAERLGVWPYFDLGIRSFDGCEERYSADSFDGSSEAKVLTFDFSEDVRREIAQRYIEEEQPGYNDEGQWYLVDGERVQWASRNRQFDPWHDGAAVISISWLVGELGGAAREIDVRLETSEDDRLHGEELYLAEQLVLDYVPASLEYDTEDYSEGFLAWSLGQALVKE